MPLSKNDRIAFSLQIVGSDSQVKALTQAKAQLQTQISLISNLDIANKNLFDPVNARVTNYQTEYGQLDGNLRTTIAEQNIQDSANRKIQNFFFPNDTSVSVPSLSSVHNVWTKVKPFAITYAIGKNYTEAYGSTPKEGDDISVITTLISSTSAYTDTELTTGEVVGGSCSLPSYTTQPTCVGNGGIWTPGGLVPSPDIIAIKNNMVTAVNALVSFLTTEASIIVTDDTAAPNQANNAAAISNINTVIKPALATWLAYPDFDVTAVGPSKLHSVQLTALSTALSTRLSFIATRIGQLATVLGTIVQDLSTGDLTSSTGLYGKRYGFLALRLNALGGSLSQLSSLNLSKSAQDSIILNILSTKATYLSVLPTSILKASGNGTTFATLVDSSFFNPGDTVYIIADGQDELQRAVKSSSNGTIVLNDIVPAKYLPSSNARIYKDIS